MSSSEVIVVFLALLIANTYAESEATNKEIAKKCEEEYKWTIQKKGEVDKLRRKQNGTLKLDQIPLEAACADKCIYEKHGYIKDGVIVMEKFDNDDIAMSSMKDPEEYMRCLASIGKMKDCNDFKPVYKCMQDFAWGRTQIIELCNKEHHWTTKQNIEFQRKITISGKKPDVNDYPKELLCNRKCIYENLGQIKEGKVVMDRFKNDTVRLSHLIDTKGYLKCLGDIDQVKECDDIKKIIKCFIEFSPHYGQQCAKENKIDMKEMYDELENTRKIPDDFYCIKKCILEKYGVIDKDGKIVIENAKIHEPMLFWRLKNKEEFTKCLEDLSIKDCVDVKNIYGCKSHNLI